MSARIILFPKRRDTVVSICAWFNARGYTLYSTRHGYIEAKIYRGGTIL